MIFKNIILGKRSQTQKGTHSMIVLLCNAKSANKSILLEVRTVVTEMGGGVQLTEGTTRRESFDRLIRFFATFSGGWL